jgi:Protein of unknown function (DUF4232)
MRLAAHSFTRLSRARALGLTAALGSVGALAAVAAPASGSAVAAGTPACQTAGLVVWLSNGDGAAGSVFYTMDFTNLSGHTCTLRGYPGVSAVNLNGGQVGAAAVRNKVKKVKTITLAQDKTVAAILRVVNAGVFSPSACQPTTAAGLRVFPPNQTASKVVPLPFGVCTRGKSTLSIEAVAK